MSLSNRLDRAKSSENSNMLTKVECFRFWYEERVDIRRNLFARVWGHAARLGCNQDEMHENVYIYLTHKWNIRVLFECGLCIWRKATFSAEVRTKFNLLRNGKSGYTQSVYDTSILALSPACICNRLGRIPEFSSLWTKFYKGLTFIHSAEH